MAGRKEGESKETGGDLNRVQLENRNLIVKQKSRSLVRPRLLIQRGFDLLFGNVIDHEDVLENRLGEFGDKLLMRFVGKVDVESGLVLEGHDEAMGKALGTVLGAHIGAPLEINDRFDLALESGKFGFELLDLFGGGFLLEFEADDMTERSGHFFFSGGFFFVVIGKRKDRNKGDDGNKKCFHEGSVRCDEGTHEEKGGVRRLDYSGVSMVLTMVSK